MNETYRQSTTAPYAGRADMAVDAGLRSYMLGVFNKMALGLVVTGLVAYAVGNIPFLTDVFLRSPLRWVVMFGPLAVLLIVPFAMRNPSPTGTAMVYWAVVAMLGLSLGSIFLVYTNGSIAQTFFATAAAFGGLSLWGYTTKKDLTGFGNFLIIGLIGLIVAGLINIFLQSPMMHFVISGLGVLIFAGLTAFDTQRLKYQYYEFAGDSRALGVATNFGALSMYLNFVNLFQFLLAFLGNRE